MRPLVFHDWRAVAATVATLGACAIVMRAVWRSRPRIAPSGADRRHLGRYTRGLAAVHLLALGAPFAAPALTLPGPPWPPLAAGLALYVVGQALRGWAIATLGDWFQGTLVVQDDQRVVQSGPYRVIRHPAYAGGILRAAGTGLVLDNWLSLVLLLVAMIAFVAVRIRREEEILRIASHRTANTSAARLVSSPASGELRGDTGRSAVPLAGRQSRRGVPPVHTRPPRGAKPAVQITKSPVWGWSVRVAF